MKKAVEGFVDSIIQLSLNNMQKAQNVEEREALSNASLNKINVELSEKQLIPLKSPVSAWDNDKCYINKQAHRHPTNIGSGRNPQKS